MQEGHEQALWQRRLAEAAGGSSCCSCCSEHPAVVPAVKSGTEMQYNCLCRFQHNMLLAVQRGRTFCPMPTITPWCLGRPTMLGNTALGASSPANPACKRHNCGISLLMRSHAGRGRQRACWEGQLGWTCPQCAVAVREDCRTLTMPEPLSHTRADTWPSSSMAVFHAETCGRGGGAELDQISS